MTIASIRYRHPTRMAEVLQAASSDTGPNLSRIPYNRFAESEDSPTTWWLSPVSDNPAYQWGKIIVSDLDVSPDLFVGLYIEKGVGESAAMAFNDRSKTERMVMKKGWLWPDFFKAITDGTIENSMRHVSRNFMSPVLLAIDAQVATPAAEWNTERYKLPRDYIRFAATEPEFVCEAAAKEPDLLRSLNGATNLSEIAESISRLPQLDWIWIDVMLGYIFATEPKDGVPAWDGDHVWSAAGAPWKDWLR